MASRARPSSAVPSGAGTMPSVTSDLAARVWSEVARWLAGIPLARDRSPFLEYGQDVAGGVLEPRNVRASAAEDALLVLLKAVVALEAHSTLGQLIDGLVDVLNREVEDGERRRGVVRFGVDQYVPQAGDVQVQ